MIHKAKYVSVWDDGVEIKTKCTFDDEHKIVYDIETSEVEGLEILQDEYVLLDDGTEIREFQTEDDYYMNNM